MSFRNRLAAANAVIDEMSRLTEWRVDEILRRAGTTHTPAGWNTLSLDQRRGILEKRIAADADLVPRLQKQIPAPETVQAWRSIAEGLVDLKRFELALLISDAAATTPYDRIPNDWESQTADERRGWLEDVLFASSEAAREKLRDEAGLRVDAEPAGQVVSDEWETPAAAALTAGELEAPTEQRITVADESSAIQAEPEVPSARPVVPAVDADGPIFVVHGHDEATLYQVVRVLEKATDRDVLILHEQANSGRTILEKFEDHAAAAAYAVVLLTSDDVGGEVSGGDQRPRARQNVIFELGFFFGKLGRGRVAVLLAQGVEKPSDIDGLVYITRDPAGAWGHTLAREMSTAGIEVDHAKIP